jgi:glycosyltransferase involved in cell wall biosynthesis
VNANFEHYPKQNYPKQVSLVPSFGIRIFSLFETIYFSTSNLAKGFKDILNNNSYNITTQKYEKSYFKNVIRHILNYLKNYFKRLPLEAYNNQTTIKSNYIFFLSTLWYSNDNNKNDEGVNRRRANFIEACKEIGNIAFEGGLFAGKSSSPELFKECLTYEKISLNNWIKKTKESILVFNTPAFWNCHGWKLGEYLALGKAIISTPLSNDLPVPLIHGEHIHIINNDSPEEMKKAILYIANNDEYRKKLETNVKAYWKKFGTPQKSLELLGLIPMSK